MPSREEAWALVQAYTQSPALLRHMLAVEAAMRAYARKLGEDEHYWGLVGLLHDFDYEKWPNPPDHPLQGARILQERGYPADLIYAIKSHADYLPDCPRLRPVEKALYACDELTGFIMAVAVIRPQGIRDLTAASVIKKLKTKGFAAKVSREDIYRGATDFGVPLEEHIDFLIEALRPLAGQLGLEGTAANVTT
ncbi:MAG: HAD family hydrolase [Gemmataceae bacterium]